ncbi:Ribose ABC transport system, permease protein RbsC (TC 3.A.1.2.1) [Halanaerobium saccharolyticum subsp. saccharolyticum DSM 6643]|jgi:ribose transport system permease protein|uniref:Ribose ABC transport system, permease protein RbsC (TC 3.A.1.2.1) n=1 Tax=Halanaerobium saccharolyticum subsp. saccharolyticum DSM 6643 TaxID=1293054 RepID=M5ECL5_9FIRM|nr:ABC transporter permease [Halanaerobium saccharolyticum]CCU78641.1 Ribose ABC transport system, permease protein RbsC (TC 3.A.1.2.1) [Halanaerobium saccharolyticum subsp. saccharolyticum DSM 6643]
MSTLDNTKTMNGGFLANDKTVLDYLSDYGIYLGFLIIFAIFSVVSSSFFTVSNVSNIIIQSSIIAIIAIGQTVVILTEGIDLSVGSIAAFISIALGIMMVDLGIAVPLALFLSIVMGAIIGLINGFVISYGKVPAFITTLGMMSIARGGALAINGGRPVSMLPRSFGVISSASVFGIPIFIIYVAVFYTLMYFLLTKHKLGRYIYAIGDNSEASRLSGIKVKAVKTSAYIFSGLFAAMGGIMLTARLNYASPTSGSGFELDAIAAVVIGGTALSGGQGSILGTLVGALILGTLRNGLSILNVPGFYQQIIIGVVIIVAVFFDKMKRD